jgi:hypothetical protein
MPTGYHKFFFPPSPNFPPPKPFFTKVGGITLLLFLKFASCFMNFPLHLVQEPDKMLTVPRLAKKHTNGKFFERAFIWDQNQVTRGKHNGVID